MTVTARVLFVDDEAAMCMAAEQAFKLANIPAVCLPTAESALKRLSPEWEGVLVTDVKLPGVDGIELMHEVLAMDCELPVILISGHADIAMAVDAIRDGAYDFIEKPFPADRLTDISLRALEKRRLVLDNRALREELALSGTGSELLGRSTAIRELKATLAQLSRADTDVLIVGETGTGKELVARQLHELSERRHGRFVAVNCGAVPENIFESEVFGHKSGAFTGANSERIGKFEYADGGTFFLDEVESLPLALQVKLLRVLQERKIERLGSNLSIDLNVRVVAAAKADLAAACERNEFREDLYYRLNVVTLDITPLRDRREDIPLLFQHYLQDASNRLQKDAPVLSAADLGELMAYDWPGNVRELRNLAQRRALGITNVPWRESGQDAGTERTTAPLARQVEVFEKHVIEQELARHEGNITATYNALGLSRKTLYDKMQKYRLAKDNFRPPPL